MADHITSPDPQRGPYTNMLDADLLSAYEAVAIDPESEHALHMLAELQRRELVETGRD